MSLFEKIAVHSLKFRLIIVSGTVAFALVMASAIEFADFDVSAGALIGTVAGVVAGWAAFRRLYR